MSLAADGLDDIRAYNARRGPQCQAPRVIDAMTDEQRDKMRRALADRSIERKAIWRWLTGLGIDITWSSFEHHTKGECACER